MASNTIVKFSQRVSLSLDVKVNKDLSELTERSNVVCSNISSNFQSHRRSIERHALSLARASSPSEVDVQRLVNCLDAATKSFEVDHRNVVDLQTFIQSIIEPCRCKIKNHNADIEQKLLEKSSTEDMLEEKEGQKWLSEITLSVHEQNCRQAKENAEICDATKKRAIGCGTISTVATVGVGALFAPFTGGLSLAAGIAVAAPQAIVCGTIAIKGGVEEKKWERKADSQRRKAEECCEKIRDLEENIQTCEESIGTLNREKVELEQAVSMLESFTSELYPADEATTMVCDIIKDFLLALRGASLQSESFRIIQGVFAKQPKKLGPSATRHVLALKQKWDLLTRTLDESENRFLGYPAITKGSVKEDVEVTSSRRRRITGLLTVLCCCLCRRGCCK